MLHVFLDLEGTVLDDFTKGLACCGMHHAAVSEFLESLGVSKASVFSFALDTAQDLQDFQQLKPWLEGSLGVTLDTPFITEDLRKLSESTHQVFDSLGDCKRFYGKTWGFEQYLRLSKTYTNCTVLLVDDDVPTHTVYVPELNLTVDFRNVASLL